ncbi:hypothetical protein P353_19520 [Comamonas testosteroni]|uniref:ArsA/GET3 Anion-transporting ATPase-like domain-containing protein n=2 Tax=Comamonas TaxID=283 RepID=A0A096F9R4_COMTE|nr:hypothetical protein P245_04430 [Comamonas thiooxydans]KGH27066.1 hypothetical protein P353_19520 [Comamonas testosteroni]
MLQFWGVWCGYHREIARQMDSAGLHYTTPLMDLQNPAKTKVIVVTLAETTPVLEAASLQSDLRRAGITPWAWIVNNSVAAARPGSALLQQRARNELREIDAVAHKHADRYAVVRLLREEPTGIERLSELSADGLDQEASLITTPGMRPKDFPSTPTGQGAFS